MSRLSAHFAVIPTGTDRMKRGTLWRVYCYAKLADGDQSFAIIDNRANRFISTSSCMVVLF